MVIVFSFIKCRLDAPGNSISIPREVIVEEGNSVYLDANGITVKAYDWAEVGTLVTIGDLTYKKYR